MTEEQKMLFGEYYNGLDPQLAEKRERAQKLCMQYNHTCDGAERAEILSALLSRDSSPAALQGPIWFTYGEHTRFGIGCYANFNLTVLDHAAVTVGDKVMFGPNCTLLTAQHPLHPDDRAVRERPDGTSCDVESAAPISIGSRCWLAAGVTVCPGVTIGEGSVIGAGSVVTSDIPAGVLAAGVPCRVIREITSADRLPEP